MTRRLSPLRDRPVADGERRSAMLGVLAVLAAVSLLLALTHSQGSPALRAASSPPPQRARASMGRPLSVTPHAAASVARRFLGGYLAYAYDGRPAGRVPDASPQLLHSLEYGPSGPAPSVRARLPRIVSIRVAEPSPGAITASAVLNDGGIVNYTVSLALARQGSRLVVTGLGSSR